MEIIEWDTFAENGIDSKEPVSFTTGVFDGLHRGHHELINCLVSREGTTPVLATFVSNPFKLLRPQKYLGDISTIDQKIKLLEQAGVATLILIDFSLNFSKLSGRDFLGYVRKHLDMSHLVLGKDHKLGNNGDTSSLRAKELLEPKGVVVDIVEPLFEEGSPVSSTRIRKSILAGDFCDVEKLLGRKYVLDITNSEIQNRDLTAYLRREDIKQVLPPEGEYAVILESGLKTFATKIKIIEDRILLENKPGFQAKELTFNCSLQE